MLRGLLSGTAVSAIVVVAAAQLLPKIELPGPPPEAGEVAVPAGSEFNAERADVPPQLPSTEGRPGATEAPEGPQPGAAETPVQAATPAETPVTGAAEAAMGTPATGDAPEIGGTDAGVEPVPGTPQPAEPGVDDVPVPEAPAEAPAAGGGQDALVPPEDTEAEPDLAGTGDVEVAVAETAAPAPDAPRPEADPVAEAPAQPPAAAGAPSGIGAPPAQPDLPRVIQPDPPRGLGSAPEIAGIAPGSEADSLPNIGAGPEAPEDEVPAAALERYATPFTPERDAPLVSLVLIDMPGGPEAADLAELPVPVTVALDPTRQGVGARMAALRQAGVEIAVLTPLPDGATPADVEVAFQGFLDAVPQAVAVMDLPQGLLQESRPRAAQVAEILAETGHGMVTYERGLNSGLQVAQGRGVPALTVFRDFDDGARDAAAMRRFLDKGAFRAGQAGPVVMVGQLRPVTITALTEWAGGNRASTVNLAPVSAVLMAQ